MAEVKLSVCIPVFNGGKYIKIAIDSVISQSYSDYEILIIDNNSTDNTVEVVSNIHDPRIRLIRNESNIGLIPNWNKALENAKGKYIKILPADDLIYPDCLAKQCAILDKDIEEKISLVSSRRNIINDSGKVLFNRGFSKTEVQVSGIDAINKNVRSGGNIIGEGGALMFRKNIINKTGNFNSDIFYVLDLDLWYKILLHGDMYCLPENYSAFRVSDSSASVHVINEQLRDVSNFIKKTYKQKEYKISWINCKIGLLKAFILTTAKKVLYKYLIK